MVQKSDPNSFEIRQDLHSAERIIKRLFPDQSEYGLALDILSETILCASRIAPASWGVSLFEQRLCLNVGRGAVLQFYSNDILFIVTGRLFEMIPEEDRSDFRFTHKYSFVTDAAEGRLSARSLSKYGSFKRAHTDLVERAALNRKVCFWPYSHSSSVVNFLRQQGFSIPDPDYMITTSVNNEIESESAIDIDETDHATIEGRRILRQHLIRERDPRVTQRKKRKVIESGNRLECEVCQFDFEKTYGAIGHDFAEVHHLRPLGTSKMPSKTRLLDLAIVCSNCHRMLHRGNPLFSISELREKL